MDLSWRARLVGPDDRDPAYAAAVRDAVRTAGLEDRVEIPGAMTREAAWAGADLALLPSRVETFGMVVTEALARGARGGQRGWGGGGARLHLGRQASWGGGDGGGPQGAEVGAAALVDRFDAPRRAPHDRVDEKGHT